MIPTGVGPADYQGTLKGGRKVAVEAKSTGDRLSFLDVLPHQRADLDAVEAMGGLSLLVVEIREDVRASIYVVPWRDVPWASKRRGSRTVGGEELAPWRWVKGLYLAAWVST